MKALISDILLDPLFIQQIEATVLRARRLVEGTLSGVHKSPHRGSSIEFLEHKQYSPGDEIRNIDWKLVARTDKYYVKQFEDETNLRAIIVVDASGSMNYGEGAEHKLGYAVHLAAAITYLLLKQSDAVGVLSQGTNGERTYIPPRSRSSHFQVITEYLARLTGEGGNRWVQYLEELAGTFHKRGMFVILSDLLINESKDSLARILRILRSRLHEVLVLHILHGDELRFPFTKTAVFKSLEDERRLLVEPRTIRKQYMVELAKFVEQVRSLCVEAEADYAQIDTAQPIEQSLAAFLASRIGR